MVYDLVIVGSGMIGSAAAYHASCVAGKSVCLVGPPEPTSREGREVFGSWYDVGRICRLYADDHTWSVFAVQSMKKYKMIEEESGVNFWTESGMVYVFPDHKRYQNVKDKTEQWNLPIEDVSTSWRKHFDFLNLPDASYVMWERELSGHINPRKLVEAHQTMARKNGTDIISDVVHTIQPAALPASHKWDILTEGGKVINTHAVLVAAGAYAGFKRLFDHVAPKMAPDLHLWTQTIALLRVSPKEAERLKAMPSMITGCCFGNLDGAFILPPILYPDGNWYLKLGHRKAYEVRKHTLGEVADWFKQRTGTPECVEELSQFLRHMLPGLEVEEVKGECCITAHTPESEPYIDVVADGFGVALGGNGGAAKSCHEIGRLAARLVLLGEWDSEVPRDRVKIRWKTTSSI